MPPPRTTVALFTSLTRRLHSQHIDSHSLTIQSTKTPKPKPDYDSLKFGHIFSDHMLDLDWDKNSGWHTPKIIPYANISLSPAASGLHYGLQCFEGMKAYKDNNNNIRLFRPLENVKRLDSSMKRLGMPCLSSLDKESLIECLKKLLRQDAEWVPDRDGFSMYLRPTVVGTSPYLGVQAAEHVKLFVIMSPVGPYFRSGFSPIKLFADTENIRAWPGGVGNVKIGGNYGSTILPSRDAMEKHGCSQVLWLYGSDHFVTEVGSMNIFFVLRIPNSDDCELVTAPLTNGDILPGVTRSSILDLVREEQQQLRHLRLKASERWISMKELQQAEKEGRLLESFGAGTAAVVCPVKSILYGDSEIKCVNELGPVTKTIHKVVTDIQYGRQTYKDWSVLC